MRLRHIEVFQAVMETGSMSAAGRLIHLTQSAVSRLISSAEMQLGYPLFHRAGGRLVPTAEALTLFSESSQIFERLEAFRHMARHLQSGDQGILRVGAIPALCHKLVPDALTAFQLKYPDVVCQVHTAHKRQLANELLTRDIDVGLDFFGMSHPGIQAKALGTGGLYIMLPAACSKAPRGSAPTRAEVARVMDERPMVALLDDDPIMMSFSRQCQLLQLKIHVRMQVQTSQLAEEMVALNCGWTVVDFLTAAKCSPGVRVAPWQPGIECTVNAFSLKNSPPSMLARRFLEVVRKVLSTQRETRRPLRRPCD
jgi:DNA-binding transcriptional LysR family regulator